MDLLSAHNLRQNDLRDLSGVIQSYKQLQFDYEEQRLALIDFKHKANYWKAQFDSQKNRETKLLKELHELKAGQREEKSKREFALEAEVESLRAALHKREHQLFGKKTEKANKQEQINTARQKSKNPRGKQAGTAGHKRRNYDHLEVIDEELSLADSDMICPCCGLRYSEFPGTDDSEILELIHVKAYRRRIHRKKYRRNCTCKGNPASQIITTPTASRLFPKCKIGISIWAMLVLKKYEYQLPLNRILKELTNIGLSLPVGTVTDGMKKLIPLLSPVYDAIAEHSIHAKHWHADETRWKVFETTEEKKNYRWYLWIFHNAETVVYKVHPTRSSAALKEYFGEEHDGGTLNVDRYSAYKAIAKGGLFILAFCWAHVRRDFISYAKGYKDDESWAFSWVDRIGNLYHLNKQRLQYRQSSSSFRKYNKKLHHTLSKYREEIDKQLAEDSIKEEAKKLLISLVNHWEGLTVFAENPMIPMDNNIAESGLRQPVVGRKNYYGSGAIWAAQLASQLFSLFETLKLHQVNIHTWLLAYLQECAFNQGNVPKMVERFLPWNMNDVQKALFTKPPNDEKL